MNLKPNSEGNIPLHLYSTNFLIATPIEYIIPYNGELEPKIPALRLDLAFLTTYHRWEHVYQELEVYNNKVPRKPKNVE